MKMLSKIKEALRFLLPLSLFFLHCIKGQKAMEENVIIPDENWKGKTIAAVCNKLGKPDTVESAEFYSAKFTDGIPSIVLTYNSLKKRWFITREGYVLGVVPIKE